MKKITMILFATLLMVSCGEKSEDKKEEKTTENSQKEKTEDELVEFLDATSTALKEGALKSKEEADKAVIQLAANATILSNKYPENKKAPKYLEDAATMVDNFLGKPEQAYKLYNLIITNHPNYVDLDKVMYFKAIILDVNLNKLDQAEKAYKEMLERFPNSQFAESVKGRLQNIDKTFDELTTENTNQAS